MESESGRRHIYTFNKETNNLLAQTTPTLKQGKALCIAMGRPQFGSEKNANKELFENEVGFEILFYQEKESMADHRLDKNEMIDRVLSKRQ